MAASIASSTFSLACGEAAQFDSRIWTAVTDDDVVDYFRWRQADAARCALNGWCYWSLRNQGATITEATRELPMKTRYGEFMRSLMAATPRAERSKTEEL